MFLMAPLGYFALIICGFCVGPHNQFLSVMLLKPRTLPCDFFLSCVFLHIFALVSGSSGCCTWCILMTY
jgi:hypothetical protein